MIPIKTQSMLGHTVNQFIIVSKLFEISFFEKLLQESLPVIEKKTNI